MKYHNLFIHFEDELKTSQAVTTIMGVEPAEFPPSRYSSPMSSPWTHQVISQDEEPYFDFINVFLDLLEEKYPLLAAIGIQKSDILIWLVYEYDEQCSLSFSPQEMRRLGESGIALNIDCHKLKRK